MKTIPLRRRDGSIRALARVDDADYERLSGMRWSVERSGSHYYAAHTLPRGSKPARFRVHRYIVGATDPNIEVDHIDGDGLNNQRHNLRIVTHAQNQQNRRGASSNSQSRVRGVSLYRNGRWRAATQLGGRHVHLGYYATQTDAEAAVIAWRRDHMPYSNN